MGKLEVRAAIRRPGESAWRHKGKLLIGGAAITVGCSSPSAPGSLHSGPESSASSTVAPAPATAGQGTDTTAAAGSPSPELSTASAGTPGPRTEPPFTVP